MTDDIRLHRGIIRQTIKDLASNNLTDYRSAAYYVNSAMFAVDADCAGYPAELRDSLKEMVLLSQAQRLYLSRKIIKLLDQRWGKKNPTGVGS